MTSIIGILAEIDNDFNTRVQPPYIKAIELAGGLPVLLPYVSEDETIDSFISICDGFFFTGGADVDPKRYDERPKATCGEIQYNRDELEFKVLEKVLNTSKPILAICRGAQLVNVALGGTLYQDISSEIGTQISHRQSEPKFAPSHDVNVVENTPLYTLVGTQRIHANSFHHQALNIIGKNLDVTAFDEESGIPEAIEHSYLPVYGVQWHPERMDNNLAFHNIFV